MALVPSNGTVACGSGTSMPTLATATLAAFQMRGFGNSSCGGSGGAGGLMSYSALQNCLNCTGGGPSGGRGSLAGGGTSGLLFAKRLGSGAGSIGCLAALDCGGTNTGTGGATGGATGSDALASALVMSRSGLPSLLEMGR